MIRDRLGRLGLQHSVSSAGYVSWGRGDDNVYRIKEGGVRDLLNAAKPRTKYANLHPQAKGQGGFTPRYGERVLQGGAVGLPVLHDHCIPGNGQFVHIGPYRTTTVAHNQIQFVLAAESGGYLVLVLSLVSGRFGHFEQAADVYPQRPRADFNLRMTRIGSEPRLRRSATTRNYEVKVNLWVIAILLAVILWRVWR